MEDFPGGTVVKYPPASVGTWVQALVREDRHATEQLSHNYWACALEPMSHNYWACVSQLLKAAHLEPVLRNKKPATATRSLRTAAKSSPCSPQVEKAHAQQWRPNVAKNKI